MTSRHKSSVNKAVKRLERADAEGKSVEQVSSKKKTKGILKSSSSSLKPRNSMVRSVSESNLVPDVLRPKVAAKYSSTTVALPQQQSSPSNRSQRSCTMVQPTLSVESQPREWSGRKRANSDSDQKARAVARAPSHSPSTEKKGKLPETCSSKNSFPTQEKNGSFFTVVEPIYSCDPSKFTENIRELINTVDSSAARQRLAKAILGEGILAQQHPDKMYAKHESLRKSTDWTTVGKDVDDRAPRNSNVSFRKSFSSVPLDEHILRLLSPEAEFSSSELVMMPGSDGVSLVKGGTVEALIRRLGYTGHTEHDYLSAFLLTYRSFTTPNFVLSTLLDWFHYPLPPNLSAEYLEIYVQKKKRPLQLRVCAAIKNWVEYHWYDFVNDPSLSDKLLNWVEKSLRIEKGFEKVSFHLAKSIHKKMFGVGDLGSDVTLSTMSQIAKHQSLFELEPMRVARQLTLLEQGYYRAIQPKECLSQAWNTKKDQSPNICSMISRSNSIPLWIATEITAEKNLKKRAKIISYFLQLAADLLSLNNFNGATEVSAGLQLSAVYRLKKSWELVNRKAIPVLDQLQQLSAKNWKVYRDMLKACDPPCVPYLGVYLTDLTFIEDGNPDMLEGGLINFDKRRRLAVVIRDLQQYQQVAYDFSPELSLQECLRHVRHIDSEALFAASLSCERREK